ncbi:MAG: sugar porter family MFS transporter [Spirochaetes bacterium]|nr:sugar porter family MFS transporter [Spirochaetota bacterium]
MNTRLIGATVIAALGGLLFGFDTAVISGTTHRLQGVFGLTSFWLGLTVASALMGTILGSITAGRPADRYGRKTTLSVVALLYLVSAAGSALAWDWYSFVAFRLIGGLGVGGASVVSPMYIAELSPAQYRGRLVAVTQFNIVLGILLAFFSNYCLAGMDLGESDWRWMFGVEAFPALAFFLLLFLVPRSPRWLVAAGRTDEARAVLQRYGTDTGDVGGEIDEIGYSLRAEHRTLREPLFQRRYRRPILLAMAIAAFNQLSGINAVMYYAPRIFEMAGSGASSALLQTVAVGGTNLILTMAALAVIDRIGRRKLMLAGSLGYIASLGVTAWAFCHYGSDFTESGGAIVLAGLLVFIASHAFGQGAVIWVFLGEIFPTAVRARGQALGSTVHWIMAAAISWTFPMIAELSGGHTFVFYAICMIGQLVWVIRAMPETKGVTLEEMQRRLGIE